MKKLLDDPIAPELRALLVSAEVDAPAAPEDRQDRILAAISASSPTAGAELPLAVSSAVGRFGSLVRVAKWTVPLVGSVIAAAIVTSWATSTHAPPSTTAPSVERPAGPTENRLPDPGVTPSPEQTVRVEDLPTAAPGRSRVDGPPSRAAAPAKSGEPTASAPEPRQAPEPSIDSEISAIDAARGALAADRPAETFARVQGYRSTFTTPHFADEADALEIRALAALGRSEEARRKAEQFLSARPHSPYAQRVRSAVGLK